ncbi:MAG: ATP-grasp domain-containing protein [Candidatus Binataceae bacterium]|nr:ATP-grasp domain-containing protein [Candidatus Binataceae bacterium]
MRRLRKLLIANRGEIALRIIRTARTLGLATVAVYSDADAGAPHTIAADEAIRIGPPEASASYLNIDAILTAARTSAADAIHPGYGFLSERADFARAVTENGIVFVGPGAASMAALGNKVAARRLAIESGVPVVPGIDTADENSAAAFAAQAGFPILIKAAAGGGGRGMRVVETAHDLAPALEAAAREASAAFGDGSLFLERYLAFPRHVEVQVLGDRHGKLIVLGDRDCSIQRRHQKIIEESPAPGLSEGIRHRMAESALRLFQAAGYFSAGTAEFLVEGDQFHFLEANTRLQVEHPVTEMRFGWDLVAEQLKVAAGDPLGDPPVPRGHAIECRIYAEDAEHGFQPDAGRIDYLSLPAGPGVRIDTHLMTGAEVSTWYDGMLAKLICWGVDREQARRRMIAALAEFSLLGVRNTASFLRDIMASQAFRAASLSTRFLEQFFPNWRPDHAEIEIALIAAALSVEGLLNAGPRNDRLASDAADDRSRSPWAQLPRFELWGRQ